MKNKIFLLIISLLITSVLALFFVTFQIQKSTINKLSTEQLNEKSIEKVNYFNNFISHRKILLSSLTLNKDFINFAKNKNGRQYIENIFLSYALTHKDIFQFRYIDLKGNELIRVDNYSKPLLVEKEQLQNKKTRYYFQNTLKLNKEEYFFSNINLNQEYNKIQKPIIPTLRIATPIVVDGIKYGILIININIQEVLKYLQDSHLYYVNLIYDDGETVLNKYKEDNENSNSYTLLSNLPKNFHKSDLIKTEDFYIQKLDINTKDKIYMILQPKKLELYDLLYEDLTQNSIFLILLILLFLPISYYITKYIENYYQKQLSMEEELQKLRIAIDHSPISVVITNREGVIEYVNPYFCKITGYTQNEIIGQNPKIIKSDLTSPAEYKELWETLLSKKTWKGTFKNITKEGKEFWETALITPIFDENNDPINFLAIKQEISKEIYLKEELKSRENMMLAQSRHAAMGEMISMIAHQWRQPLSSISMIASNTLLDIEFETVNNDTLREQAEAIIKQVRYLSDTIDDFRDFFKPNKEEEILDPKQIIDETLNIMGKSLEKSTIDIEILSENTSKVEIYSRELLQVLINLLKNAQEALEKNDFDNRKIKISITQKDDTVRIEVSDNAGGIEEALLDKVFEPYFSTKDERTGTGLGLYMSKTIIEKHLRGIFGVYNNKEGASFFIDLPIYKELKV